MKQPPFLNSHIYHVYNRGVEKRDIFMDDHDRFQFIHDLFEFNDENAVVGLQEYGNFNKSVEVEPPQIKRRQRKEPRKLLTDILAFVLMGNHFHLLLRQKIDNGVPKFMHKMGTGYTMSFNKKYERVGSLFQGRYKAVLVEKEEHLRYLPIYIHLNPIKLFPICGGSTSTDWEFLKNYRWSSLPDYIGKKNFPSVTQREFLSTTLGSTEEYKKEIQSWLRKNENVGNMINEII
ncbi:MAG: transposase [Patescibacteria group bacterium]